MIKLIMITGFLGSGKTTLIKEILNEFRDERVAVLVNEFGKVNIDAGLIKQDGIEITELNGGSVFCACIKEDFVKALAELSGREIDYLFIEASGLADPANMCGILKGQQLSQKYEYAHCICVADAGKFSALEKVLVAMRRQIEYSDFVILNKSETVSKKTVESTVLRIQSIKAEFAEKNGLGFSKEDFPIYTASHCRVDVRSIVDAPPRIFDISGESSNKKDERAVNLFIRQNGIAQAESANLPDCQKPSKEELTAFLCGIAPFAYRIKGFVALDDGIYYISCTGTEININSWERAETYGLTVISSVGIEIYSRVSEAKERYIKGKFTL